MEELPVIDNFQGNNSFIEPDRVMAQVVRITEIVPIKGADKIQLAKVLGWEVVIKMNEFKVGELVVYFSIGSLLHPDTPIFQQPGFNGKRPLMTRKIMGVISQGILGPLDWAFNYKKMEGCSLETGLSSVESMGTLFTEGEDVTKLMKVRKYVSKDELAYENSGNGDRSPFPSFIPKTDEERIQNMLKVKRGETDPRYQAFKDKEVVLTQKYDGTSVTYGIKDGDFFICSRNTLLHREALNTAHYFEISERYKLKEKFLNLKRNIAIQGEIIGPRINGNRHFFTKTEFYVFNIYDIDERRYLCHAEFNILCNYLEILTVPIVYRGLMKEEWLGPKGIKKLLALATEQFYPKEERLDNSKSDNPAEGLVLKTLCNETSCKIISNSYLIKYSLC